MKQCLSDRISQMNSDANVRFDDHSTIIHSRNEMTLERDETSIFCSSCGVVSVKQEASR